MGLTGLLIDEQYGGAGAGPVEMGIAMEEMGRALLVSPFLSTAVLVPSLLAEAGDAAECAAVLPRIAAGELIATVAFAEDGSARLPATIATSAGAHRRRLARHRLQAFRARRAVGGTVVRAGRHRRGPRRVRGRRRCSRPGRDTADHGGPDPQAMPSAIRRYPGAFDRPAGCRRRGVQCGAGRLRAVALVSEQAGGARRAVEMATEYAKTRYQFGRAIGSFQAVKHMCADMLLEAESTVSAARFVAGSFAEHAPSASSRILLWHKRIARTPSSSSPRPASRYTAASDSPGSIRRTCICAGPAATPSCWAARRGTGNATCSRSEPEP